MNRLLRQRPDDLDTGGRGTAETEEGKAMREQAEKDAERRKKKQQDKK
jgi:hypothetical protein